MAFIKKYMALLIPAGILLLALLLLIPTILKGKSLRKDMEDSVRQASNVNKWISNAPSSEQARLEEVYQNEHARDAEAIEMQLRQATTRELISYNVFPEPTDTSVQIFTDFGKKFREKLDSLISQMDARSAPTDQEVHLELLRRGGDSRSERSMSRTRDTRDRNPAADVTLAIENAFLQKRASEISVYASANVFDLYSFWENYDYQGPQAIEDCWYSQLALWVYEDVAGTITSMNNDSRSSSTLSSPIKRLVGVSFLKAADYKTTGSTSRGRDTTISGDFPAYLIGSEDVEIRVPSVLGVEPWTTRKCDEDIDVIHFSVSVIVESNAVFSFMKELCREKEHKFYGYDGKAQEETFKHNQITIMQFLQEPIEREGVFHGKYRYGDAAVVKLDLICEYIFHRAGYDNIKPEKVEQLLDPQEEASGGYGY